MQLFRSAEATSLLLVVIFLTYLTSIVVSYFRQGRNLPGNVEDFDFHMFVPARDEEAVIGQTIDRLREDFETAHVWIVDDASDDRTGDIVRGRAAHDPQVHLVSRVRPDARTGKGDALNAAYARLDEFLPADTDRTALVVCVVDADGHLAPDILHHVASDAVMGDPSVGAAQVSVRMRNRDDRTPLPGRGRVANFLSRYLVRMQDVEFRTAIAAMQALRARTRSVGLGGNGQFTRLSVLDEIKQHYGEPWHGSLLEDYELGVHVMLAGYENKYINDTYVSQEGLTDFRRLVTQRTRWSQGNIQCIKYLPEIVRSRHFTSAAVLEAGYYLLLPLIQLLGMVVWPIVAWFLVQGTLDQGSTGIVEWGRDSWPLILLMVVLGVLPFAMWGPVYKVRCEPDASWLKACAWGIGMFVYIYYLYLTVPRAMYRVMRGRSGWAKTRRNAEDLTVGVTALEA
ncbi:glycosyltransferase family 2 protein [Nocardioides caeni]|uniref:Glycosyltransferase family 2 protein n=1 Tax=Nocardioides caeni TaxID=574700 RepID=A0A4S8N4N7_9ACTN|nr:glycosyltransferase family 2 protein [Nocardioides caeni]THV10521.1 glycosyltransferase family 2 protein [Nocardioides caeni]